MATQLSDISFLLSGGQGNFSPKLSLGGPHSDTAIINGILNNLFSDVKKEEVETGFVDYRAFYIANDGDSSIFDLKIWIEEEVAGGSTIQIGSQFRDEIQKVTLTNVPLNLGGFINFQIESLIEDEPPQAFSVSFTNDVHICAQNFEDAIQNLYNPTPQFPDTTVTGSLIGSDFVFTIQFTGQSGNKNQGIISLQTGGNHLTPATQPDPSFFLIQEGIPINAITPTIDNPTDQPYGILFSVPTIDSPFIFEKLLPGDFVAIWVKRTTLSNVESVENDGFRLGYRADVLDESLVITPPLPPVVPPSPPIVSPPPGPSPPPIVSPPPGPSPPPSPPGIFTLVTDEANPGSHSSWLYLFNVGEFRGIPQQNQSAYDWYNGVISPLYIFPQILGKNYQIQGYPPPVFDPVSGDEAYFPRGTSIYNNVLSIPQLFDNFGVDAQGNPAIWSNFATGDIRGLFTSLEGTIDVDYDGVNIAIPNTNINTRISGEWYPTANPDQFNKPNPLIIDTGENANFGFYRRNEKYATYVKQSHTEVLPTTGDYNRDMITNEIIGSIRNFVMNGSLTSTILNTISPTRQEFSNESFIYDIACEVYVLTLPNYSESYKNFIIYGTPHIGVHRDAGDPGDPLPFKYDKLLNAHFTDFFAPDIFIQGNGPLPSPSSLEHTGTEYKLTLPFAIRLRINYSSPMNLLDLHFRGQIVATGNF